jgi:hypothetical protein
VVGFESVLADVDAEIALIRFLPRSPLRVAINTGAAGAPLR